MEFDRESGETEARNSSDNEIEFLLFGGEHYDEPIVSGGPFVMNTEHEISTAYNDYYTGKYGKIKYKEDSI